MNKLNIKELLVGGPKLVYGDVAVISATIADSKGGKYGLLTVTDGEYNIDCKRWSYEGQLPEIGSVIELQGETNDYNGIRSIKVATWIGGNTPQEEFMKRSPLNERAAVNIIMEYISEMKDGKLKEFITSLFKTNIDIFKRVPAAKEIHHNYLSGLLQHTIEVSELAESIATIMTGLGKLEIDFDLVSAGAKIHDIGKCRSYMINGITPDMTDEGKFSEHIVMGVVMINEELNKLGWTREEFPEFLLLEHIITSHHENLEWGSPVKPCFPEALIVALADNASAKVTSMCKEINNQPNVWGDKKSFIFGTRLYKRDSNTL